MYQTTEDCTGSDRFEKRSYRCIYISTGNEKAVFGFVWCQGWCTTYRFLNTILISIFFPLGKMIGVVRSQISFIMSSLSCEIGSPSIGGVGRMKLFCAVPASVILICPYSYILKHQCILTVRHILVEYNHFAQEKEDIFGRRDEVESFRFHPTLILFFKDCLFYTKFYFVYNCDKRILRSSLLYVLLTFVFLDILLLLLIIA